MTPNRKQIKLVTLVTLLALEACVQGAGAKAVIMRVFGAKRLDGMPGLLGRNALSLEAISPF